MAAKEKALLVQQGARLALLGAQVEAARKRLRSLVERDAPSVDLEKALRQFQRLEAEWRALEQENLRYREQLMERGQ